MTPASTTSLGRRRGRLVVRARRAARSSGTRTALVRHTTPERRRRRNRSSRTISTATSSMGRQARAALDATALDVEDARLAGAPRRRSRRASLPSGSATRPGTRVGVSSTPRSLHPTATARPDPHRRHLVTGATRPRVLAVIPARGGSKGLPGKNIRPLAGAPLIAHSIRAAALTPEVTRCVVTTDSAEIAEVAAAHGGDVPFLRPSELAGDDTPMAPVVRHALEWVEHEEGSTYDAVLLARPDQPGARARTARRGGATAMPTIPTSTASSASPSPTFNPLWVGVQPDGAESGALTRFFQAGAVSPAGRTSGATCGSTATSTCGGPSSCAGSRRPGSTRAPTRRGDPGGAGLLDRRRLRVPAHRGAVVAGIIRPSLDPERRRVDRD